MTTIATMNIAILLRDTGRIVTATGRGIGTETEEIEIDTASQSTRRKRLSKPEEQRRWPLQDEINWFGGR